MTEIMGMRDLTESGVFGRVIYGSDVEIVSPGELSGTFSDMPQYWDHNKTWRQTYKDRGIEWAKAIKSNVNLVTYGLKDAAPSVGGSGLTLGNEFPHVQNVAEMMSKMVDAYYMRLLEEKAIYNAAVRQTDGNAMYELKEWNRKAAGALEESSKFLVGIIDDKLAERSAKSLSLRDKGLKASQRSTLSHITDGAAWSAMFNAIHITVKAIASGAGTLIGKAAEIPISLVSSAGEEVIKAGAKSVWQKPIFWAAVAGGGYLLYRLGVISWIAGMGKGLVEKRVGLRGLSRATILPPVPGRQTMLPPPAPHGPRETILPPGLSGSTHRNRFGRAAKRCKGRKGKSFKACMKKEMK